MNVLDELYYGNISPFERHTDRNPACRELQGYITRHMERSRAIRWTSHLRITRQTVI